MANEEAPESGRQVHAVQISCDILEALLALNEAGITELADHLEYSKGTIHGHLSTLYTNEFVVKDSGRYRLSLRFLDFSEQIKDEVKIYEIVKEETEKIAANSGEFAQFMVEEHGWGVYLHKSKGTNAVRSTSYTGHRKHLHCTALGKAILSQLPEKRVEQIIERRGLPAYTEQTITDPETLFEELESIRSNGIANDDNEVVKGLRCVATPVRTAEDQLLGAISIAGPSSRMCGDFYESEAPKMVQDAATVIAINATQV